MTKKWTWSLMLAALICGGAQFLMAQDQAPAAAPAVGTDQPAAKPAKKHHEKMDACKDDVAQYCADVKGHKAIHECLKKNEDKLSQPCKDHRAKIEKMMEKHGKKHAKKGEEQAPAAQPAPAAPPAQQ